jgi:hypothetical protein
MTSRYALLFSKPLLAELLNRRNRLREKEQKNSNGLEKGKPDRGDLPFPSNGGIMVVAQDVEMASKFVRGFVMVLVVPSEFSFHGSFVSYSSSPPSPSTLVPL